MYWKGKKPFPGLTTPRAGRDKAVSGATPIFNIGGRAMPFPGPLLIGLEGQSHFLESLYTHRAKLVMVRIALAVGLKDLSTPWLTRRGTLVRV